MNFHWKGLLLLGICYQCLVSINCASISAELSARYVRRLPQGTIGYLPPYSTTSSGDKAANAVTYSTQTAQNAETFHTSPQLNYNKKSTTQHYTNKPYSSYVPPASGSASFLYSAPQASNKIAIPSLIPKSVLEYLEMPAVATTTTQQKHQTQRHQYQQQSPTDYQVNSTPVLMVEEPPTMLLTTSQNRTLEAAKLLASTILEANGEPPLDQLNGVQVVNPHGLNDPNQLNTTDVVIVKSQKNAYIIPTQLAKDARNPNTVRELYQMRHELDRAYTINQFIFIIKPEKINFLNKLV